MSNLAGIAMKCGSGPLPPVAAQWRDVSSLRRFKGDKAGEPDPTLVSALGARQVAVLPVHHVRAGAHARAGGIDSVGDRSAEAGLGGDDGRDLPALHEVTGGRARHEKP